MMTGWAVDGRVEGLEGAAGKGLVLPVLGLGPGAAGGGHDGVGGGDRVDRVRDPGVPEGLDLGAVGGASQSVGQPGPAVGWTGGDGGEGSSVRIKVVLLVVYPSGADCDGVNIWPWSDGSWEERQRRTGQLVGVLVVLVAEPVGSDQDAVLGVTCRARLLAMTGRSGGVVGKVVYRCTVAAGQEVSTGEGGCQSRERGRRAGGRRRTLS